jgi:hypothetical protein
MLGQDEIGIQREKLGVGEKRKISRDHIIYWIVGGIIASSIRATIGG